LPLTIFPFRQLDLNWEDVLDEALLHLRRMVQIGTTNSPGTNCPFATYLATVLDAEKNAASSTTREC
jgi:hypothetical protein